MAAGGWPPAAVPAVAVGMFLLRRRLQHLGRRDERGGRRRRAPAGPHDHAPLPRRLQPRHRGSARWSAPCCAKAGVALEWHSRVTVAVDPGGGRGSLAARTHSAAGWWPSPRPRPPGPVLARLAGAADAADRGAGAGLRAGARGSPTTGWRWRWSTATTRRGVGRSPSAVRLRDDGRAAGRRPRGARAVRPGGDAAARPRSGRRRARCSTSPGGRCALAGAVLWGLGVSLGFPVGMSAAADEGRRAAGRVAVVGPSATALPAGPPRSGCSATTSPCGTRSWWPARPRWWASSPRPPRARCAFRPRTRPPIRAVCRQGRYSLFKSIADCGRQPPTRRGGPPTRVGRPLTRTSAADLGRLTWVMPPGAAAAGRVAGAAAADVGAARGRLTRVMTGGAAASRSGPAPLRRRGWRR